MSSSAISTNSGFEAAHDLAHCFTLLLQRGVNRDLAQRFILQALVALFAEDIGLLARYTLTRILEACDKPHHSFDLIGGLFVEMNTPGTTSAGRYRGVPYFNGGLFTDPARLELQRDELDILIQASRKDWSMVRPEIFGTIFEQSLEADERHAYGAHFTHPADIMKIVGPTIVMPWSEQIEKATTLRRLEQLRDDLWQFRVLDPACGSGNFLYIAYRELKRLEARLFERIKDISNRKKTQLQAPLGLLNAGQFYGIDINPFAVELAKVTMMIARKLAINETLSSENPLPLDNLDANFSASDALIDAGGRVVDWPDADVIIGNPPFLGAKRLKPERGTAYTNTVRKAYPAVPGMADYCVYWFRKAHDHLPAPTSRRPYIGRAGLVGTQNVRNNKSRVGGLDYIAGSGTIIEAVGNQPWSGDAAVHVSIVNWVKTQDPALLPASRRLWTVADGSKLGRIRKQRSSARHSPAPAKHTKARASRLHYEVTYRDVPTINSALSDEVDVSMKQPLACNKSPQCCYQGKIPGYDGFMLDAEARNRLSRNSDPVIKPYLIGRELLSDFQIRRWCIDFEDRELLEARRLTSAFDHCKNHTLPAVRAKLAEVEAAGGAELSGRKAHLDRWWTFWRGRGDLTRRLSSMKRYIGCSRVTRRPIMAFIAAEICPSDLVQVFAFEDDYSFGILQSSFHFEWFRKSSRLKIEKDLRYSVRQVFETFPWPQSPTNKQVEAVAKAARLVRTERDNALRGVAGGLRELYKTLELPDKNALRDVHVALDEAVRATYGFKKGEGALASLLRLNHTVAEALKSGAVVMAPGIPPSCETMSSLVSADCLSP